MQTQTDIYAVDPAAKRRGAAHVLYIAFHGHDPARLPSRHLLADIDVIEFGRGGPSVVRDTKDGLRRLAVRVADPLMSSQHGQLVHLAGAWALEDPSSKNGAVVGGVRTRSSKVELGQVFSLGHTIFLLAREDGAGARPADLAGSDLPAPLPELATFDAELGATFDRLARVAPTELPILLLGETGTGKEVTAHAIHVLSRRRGPFVGVNCGAITPTLVESELFGHRRGAFSGATADRLGHVRTADGGTLFLDEIGDMPLPAQAALLRVLEEREVLPVGESVPVPVDLRVVAATHRDLDAMVAEGTFREDLYARIHGVAITLLPLRARRADLGLLVPALLRRRPKAERVRFTPQAASLLFEYRWPRNIRELSRALEVMTAMADGEPILVEHVPAEIRAPREAGSAEGGAGAGAAGAGSHSGPLDVEELELKARLEAMLRECDWNVTEVARRMGKDRTQIYRWMRRLGLHREGA